MDLTEYFLDFARLGAGWVMWLLVLLSILSVGVMIDRFLWFRRRDLETEAFIRELRGSVQRDEVDRFIRKHKEDVAVPIQVALRGLEERGNGTDAVAESMQAEKMRWRRAGDANLIILGTLGNNVPFVGLFGTVLGVIKAFDKLTGHTPDADQLVVYELAKALTATAVGLLVAIPAVVAFNYFSRRLKVIMGGADECAHAVLSAIYGKAAAPPAAVVEENKADGGA